MRAHERVVGARSVRSVSLERDPVTGQKQHTGQTRNHAWTASTPAGASPRSPSHSLSIRQRLNSGRRFRHSSTPVASDQLGVISSRPRARPAARRVRHSNSTLDGEPRLTGNSLGLDSIHLCFDRFIYSTCLRRVWRRSTALDLLDCRSDGAALVRRRGVVIRLQRRSAMRPLGGHPIHHV